MTYRLSVIEDPQPLQPIVYRFPVIEEPQPMQPMVIENEQG
jgi:hypothetical protein